MTYVSVFTNGLIPGAKMFSADSKGVVIIWNSYINPQVDTKRKRRGTGGKNKLDC